MLLHTYLKKKKKSNINPFVDFVLTTKTKTTGLMLVILIISNNLTLHCSLDLDSEGLFLSISVKKILHLIKIQINLQKWGYC